MSFLYKNICCAKLVDFLYSLSTVSTGWKVFHRLELFLHRFSMSYQRDLLSAGFALSCRSQEFLDFCVKTWVELDHLLDFLAGVHHSRMVASPKFHAYFGGRVFGDFTDDEHGDLPGEGDVLTAFFAFEIGQGKLVIVGYHAEYGIDRDDGVFLRVEHLHKAVSCNVDGKVFVYEISIRNTFV